MYHHIQVHKVCSNPELQCVALLSLHSNENHNTARRIPTWFTLIQRQPQRDVALLWKKMCINFPLRGYFLLIRLLMFSNSIVGAGGLGSATAPPKILICHKLVRSTKIGNGHLLHISQKYPQFL